MFHPIIRHDSTRMVAPSTNLGSTSHALVSPSRPINRKKAFTTPAGLSTEIKTIPMMSGDRVCGRKKTARSALLLLIPLLTSTARPRPHPSFTMSVKTVKMSVMDRFFRYGLPTENISLKFFSPTNLTVSLIEFQFVIE